MPSSVRPKSTGSSTRAPPVTPMSERQQMALLMQMTSPAHESGSRSPSSSTSRSRDRNERGETPLHLAAIKGDVEQVCKLLQHRADPNVADFAGWTPLHEACNHGYYDIAFRLIQAGANVNVKGLDNDTPLHDAVLNCHLKLIKLLVDKGADIHAKNSKGKCPLDLATPTVASYLLNPNLPLPETTSNRVQPRARDEKKVTTTESTNKSKCSTITADETMDSNKTGNIDDVYEFKSTTSSSTTPTTAATTATTPKDTELSQDTKTNNDNVGDVGDGEKTEISSITTTTATTTTSSTTTTTVATIATLTTTATLPTTTVTTTTSTNNVIEDVAKRNFSEIAETTEDGNNDDENRRKKRKEDISKDTKIPPQRGGGQAKGQNTKQTVTNQTKIPTTVTKVGSGEKKSPCPSPKAGNVSDVEIEDGKTDLKVPPLKIVIPQSGSGEQETGISRNGKNSSQRAHQALPYVVASLNETNDKDATGNANSPEGTAATKSDDKKETTTTTTNEDQRSNSSHQRVLRSSHRSGTAQSTDRGSNNSSPQLQRSHSPSPNASPAAAVAPTQNDSTTTTTTTTTTTVTTTTVTSKTTDTQASSSSSSTSNSNNNSNSSSGNEMETTPTTTTTTASSSSTTSTTTTTTTPAATVELHPRKRKMKPNKETSAPQPETQETPVEAQIHPHDQPITNCYQLFLNIRKQIDKRRRGLFPVQPKPPQGFKDYLMNRCTYVLASTAPTTPNITYPPTLPPPMKDLFAEQEKERYRLRMQHVIEKEKLVLSVEQEILRVHGRAARALANQSLPFSVCTILRDEEVYNLITPEQEEKDRNARSRYNGRLFLSWLQDVDDKWEKIKEHMLLRHHNEAESLHAVQKMNWEWKMKELNLCDRKTTPSIDEHHVPMVHVSDDFDLLPA